MIAHGFGRGIYFYESIKKAVRTLRFFYQVRSEGDHEYLKQGNYKD